MLKPQKVSKKLLQIEKAGAQATEEVGMGFKELPDVIRTLQHIMETNPPQKQWLHGHAKKVKLPSGRKIKVGILRKSLFEPSKKPEKGLDKILTAATYMEPGEMFSVGRYKQPGMPLSFNNCGKQAVSVSFRTSEPFHEQQEPPHQLLHLDREKLVQILEKAGYTLETKERGGYTRVVRTLNGSEPFARIHLNTVDHGIFHQGKIIGVISELKVMHRRPEVQHAEFFEDHLHLLHKIVTLDSAKELPTQRRALPKPRQRK